MLNSPRLIEEEKAKMASKEKALKEKEEQNKPSNKTNNTVNGTGGTPIHANALQVSGSQTRTFLETSVKNESVSFARSLKLAVKRFAPPSQTCAPMTSASWGLCLETLNFPTSTATVNQWK